MYYDKSLQVIAKAIYLLNFYSGSSMSGVAKPAVMYELNIVKPKLQRATT